MMSLATGLAFHLWGKVKTIAIVCIICYVDNLDQQLRTGLLLPGIEAFVMRSLALAGNIVSSEEESSFELYMCIYIVT